MYFVDAFRQVKVTGLNWTDIDPIPYFGIKFDFLYAIQLEDSFASSEIGTQIHTEHFPTTAVPWLSIRSNDKFYF